jgi:hypothetical protein
MGSALTKIGPFSLMLLLFLFIYTILGMEMFANRLRFDRQNKAVPYFGVPNADTSPSLSKPDSNFDDFPNAAISVFIVFANEGWSKIY